MKQTVAFIRTTSIYDDSRATKEILALYEAGFQVVVLGWNRNGQARERTAQLFRQPEITCDFFDVPLPSGIGMRNMDKLLRWFLWTRKKLGQIRNLAGVHACNLDGALGVARFCERRGIPLIYDIYDYYSDSHSIPKQLLGMVEGTEDRIATRCAATIICTEERREQIQNARPKRVEVIHNSPDVEQAEQAELLYDYAYCGSLCERRLVREIVEGYAQHRELRFAFAGNDIYQREVEASAASYPDFHFFGTIPYQRVLEIEKQSRVLSAIYEPTVRNHRLCAPNKFYEALALGKPLIVCRGTGIDRVVEQYHLGKVIDYDAGAFYQALTELLSQPEACAQMGERGRALYEERYRWSIMRQRLVKLYRECFSGT